MRVSPRLFGVLLLALVFSVGGCGNSSSRSPSSGGVPAAWLPTGSMVQARRGHTATLLLDGRVLIVAGTAATAELYDPVVGAFSVTGTPTVSHGLGATATRLANGRVLVVGGESSPTTAEIFDPIGEMFTATGGTSSPHWRHTATTLPNGSILVAAGEDPVSDLTIAESELYDPGTGTFSPTGSVNIDRAWATATALPGGEVLLAGGFQSLGPFIALILGDSELYDPILGTFSFTGVMSSGRTTHTATLLLDGTVLVAGGVGQFAGLGPEAEIYDPGTGMFSPTAGAALVREYWHTATLLANGRVLLAGGLVGGAATNISELYDPTTGTFAPTASMAEVRERHTATLLLDNRVLIVGGTSDRFGADLATAEVYRPGS